MDDVTHVINYQLPDEIETYTHRSGRTGRAGKSGVSMVIVSKSETRKIKSIERIIKKEFEKKEIPGGEEICQIQLFHLANDIKNSKINHDIDSYLPSINEVLEDFTKEELIKKFFSVEFTRFHNYYKNAHDLNAEGSNSSESSSGSGSTRYFINVGEKDGFDWMSLKDFLKDTLELGRDAVSRVDVKQNFSFFNTDDEHADQVLATFADFKIEGRQINIEISKDSRGGGGGKRKGGGRKRRNNDFEDRPKRSSKGGNRGGNKGGSRGAKRNNDDKNKGGKSRDRRKRSDRNN